MDFEWVAIALGDVTWITLAFVLGFMARPISLPPLVGFLPTAHHANDLLMAKTGVLLASVVAGVSGFLWLYFSAEKSRR